MQLTMKLKQFQLCQYQYNVKVIKNNKQICSCIKNKCKRISTFGERTSVLNLMTYLNSWKTHYHGVFYGSPLMQICYQAWKNIPLFFSYTLFSLKSFRLEVILVLVIFIKLLLILKFDFYRFLYWIFGIVLFFELTITTL